VTDAVVVGYGNDLRADDGAGRWVAAQIEAQRIPGVTVRSVSQLTPELTLDIAGRALVVFVDASVDVRKVTIHRIDVAPTAGPKTMTHHGDPATLLSLVPSVGAPPERAYLVSIPATELGMGFELTPHTQAAAADAVGRVLELLEGGQEARG